MQRTQPVPAGYHTITPMLNVKGASQAIDFYKRAFGAEERTRMPDANGAVMHAELKIGDSLMMLSDALQAPPTLASIHLYVDDADATFKRAVEAGAKVKMPVADMFWGDRYGQITDPFGNTWGIATHKEDVPPGEMKLRASTQRAAHP